jgi:uncharacterized protein YyaL (SSP411 family)
MPPKMVEIDENTLVSQREIVSLVADIQKNPALRDNFLRAVKEVRPNMPIPEIDVAKPIQDKLDALEAKQVAFFAKQEEAEAARLAAQKDDEFLSGWNKQKNTLLEQGYHPAAVDKVVEFAKAEGIPNLLAAAAYYEKRNPPSLTNPRASLFDAFNEDASDDGKYLKRLMDGRAQPGGVIDDGAVMHLAQNALTDIRAQNRKY